MLGTAEYLANRPGRKPRQSDLRRASSTVYYAMFHALAACCAESFVGGSRKNRAWVQVYRFLEHGFAASKCREVKVADGYPAEIQDFANCFVALLTKRYDADYNPKYKVAKLDVLEDIETARAAIAALESVPTKHKKAFSTLVLLKSQNRRS